ncbi:MAG: metallophosphoesterase [Chitinophagales bacterium]|jgi:serine/threonine protein phosphatase 1|nr:metallophosphoesterase [Bacteroidota bacterium]MBK9507081.1 metallophosphoesterase [Bacteroidota bacterium]MBP9881279.1 metallophosphoesterase [Chitinophagales bacterium]
MKRYAISDIHGCYQTFIDLLAQLNLTKEDELYLLGDLIDRGPNSKGVIDHVMQMQEDGYKVTVLMGNHEYMFLQAIDETIPYCWDWRRYQLWIKNGGITTMMNFGYNRIDDLKNLDKKYDAFVRNLTTHVELDNCILVHAGFNFKEEDIYKDKNSMYWIRHFYNDIDPAKINNKTIVHGHSARRFDTLEAEIAEKKYPAINIDCGCVYHIKSGIGRLCALDLDTFKPIFQVNTDKFDRVEGQVAI